MGSQQVVLSPSNDIVYIPVPKDRIEFDTVIDKRDYTDGRRKRKGTTVFVRIPPQYRDVLKPGTPVRVIIIPRNM